MTEDERRQILSRMNGRDQSGRLRGGEEQSGRIPTNTWKAR
jgi:hypothetical protein